MNQSEPSTDISTKRGTCIKAFCLLLFISAATVTIFWLKGCDSPVVKIGSKHPARQPDDNLDLHPLTVDEPFPTELPDVNLVPGSGNTNIEDFILSQDELAAESFASNLGVEVPEAKSIIPFFRDDEKFDARALDPQRNRRMLLSFGNRRTDQPIADALKWIIDHQLPDGGWNFDHTIGPGKHRQSPNPGRATEARTAATGLALLPLLGNGQTYENGRYKKEFDAGLQFLIKRGKGSGRGISYSERQGTMYSHALATIVLCETLAMTDGPVLKRYAQRAVWFIEDAQDPVGGGWRYEPRQRGDLSATGWQLRALKSAQLAGLEINPETIGRLEIFLDSVSTDDGAFYGYTDVPTKQVVNGRMAAGLLSRVYLGWGKDRPGLEKGLSLIWKKGPDTSKNPHVDYNYLSTQLVWQCGGMEWEVWHQDMQDALLANQQAEGDIKGSWTPGTSHFDELGGRLYTTSLSCMALEVDYRYRPLFRRKDIFGELPER